MPAVGVACPLDIVPRAGTEMDRQDRVSGRSGKSGRRRCCFDLRKNKREILRTSRFTNLAFTFVTRARAPIEKAQLLPHYYSRRKQEKAGKQVMSLEHGSSFGTISGLISGCDR
jgi:hypothetical protein